MRSTFTCEPVSTLQLTSLFKPACNTFNSTNASLSVTLVHGFAIQSIKNNDYLHDHLYEHFHMISSYSSTPLCS